MTRCRGGLNGRCPIIRTPHKVRNQIQQTKAVAQHASTTEGQLQPTPGEDARNGVSQPSTITAGNATPSTQNATPSIQNATPSTENVTPSTENASTIQNQHTHDDMHVNRDQQRQPNMNDGTTVSDNTGNPEAKLVLDSYTLWFGNRHVVDAVSDTSYKSYFKGPYYNWSETPDEVKDRWWNAFKQEFSWDPSIASLVKKEWKEKCARRLSSIVHKLLTEKSYSAAWCLPTLRKEMMETRQNDNEFKKKSEQCSKNRLNNEDQKVHHRQGSISTQEVKLNLEKKLNRTPTAAEVYFKCHADDSGQFVNNKTKEVWDDFEKKKVVNLECDSETQKSEDDIFFDVVGGWNEKGRVFGLGAAAQSYYEKPTLEERNSKRARRAESLKTQVVDLAAKNDEQKKELDETKEGLNETQAQLDETQKELSETKKTLLETTESFLNFKKQVEAFMQTSNPSHP